MVDAASVVNKFYDDLNSKNYRAAWDEGGDNVSHGLDYSSWVAGYSDTLKVTGLHTSDSGGGVVSTRFSSVHTDGSTVEYSGTYTVRGGVIVSGHMNAVRSAPTAASTTTRKAAPTTSNNATGGILLKVTGNGGRALVTYSFGTSIEQAANASIPWEKKGEQNGLLLQVSAQDDDGTSITCTIYGPDGTVLDKETSTGPYAIASCQSEG